MRRVLFSNLAVKQALAKAIFLLFIPHTIWGTSKNLVLGFPEFEFSESNSWRLRDPNLKESGRKRLRMNKTVTIKNKVLESIEPKRIPNNLKRFNFVESI